MRDQRGPYFAALDASARSRSYWAGASPDDPDEWWYFEAVEDGGEIVVIRQVTIERDGQRHAYSADHIDDGWGFLTDQPLVPQESEDLGPCTAERFRAAWAGVAVHCPRCGDVLGPMAGTLGCARDQMELSAVAEAALISIAMSEPVSPERPPGAFRVGGVWHCPADGQRMVETSGGIRCPTCTRSLPPGVVYQLVEVHFHGTGE